VEAGGHIAGEVSTLALVPRVVDAVAPHIVAAAGGIADGRGACVRRASRRYRNAFPRQRRSSRARIDRFARRPGRRARPRDQASGRNCSGASR
jgi:hypothetical protein